VIFVATMASVSADVVAPIPISKTLRRGGVAAYGVLPAEPKLPASRLKAFAFFWLQEAEFYPKALALAP